VIYVIALLAQTDVLEVGRPREHKRDDEWWWTKIRLKTEQNYNL
jgi:hypothetical protein